MQVTGNSSKALKANFGKSNAVRELALKELQLKTDPRNFLSVTFNKALAHRPGYTQYNYDSPWIYPIRLIDKKKEAEDAQRAIDSAGYYTPAIKIKKAFGYRVEPYGEVPDFIWYQKTFADYSMGKAVPLSRVDDETFP